MDDVDDTYYADLDQFCRDYPSIAEREQNIDLWAEYDDEDYQ